MWFGPAVRRIVEGETKFSKIGALAQGSPGADLAAKDLQQLFLAMTEEVRRVGPAWMCVQVGWLNSI